MPRGFPALRMLKDWAGALGLRRAVFFSCLIAHVGTQDVPKLWCYTDYETEVVCSWNAADTTDCAGEFLLQARSDYGRKWECAPENRRIPESASPSCVCVIPKEKCHDAHFTVSLFTRTNKSTERTFHLSDVVKPRPFRNLTVTKTKKRSFVLAWKKSYDPSCLLYRRQVTYEIQLSFEGQKQPDVRSFEDQTEQREFFSDQLVPGKNYTARIRYKLTDWGSYWSDWSSPCHWSSDFGPEPEDQLWLFVLLACCLVAALVSTCYCCLIRLKRQWWDQIPSPKIAGDPGKKPRPVPWQVLPAREEGKAPLCATSQERPRSFADTLPQDGPAFPAGPNKAVKTAPGSRPKAKWEAVLTPEAPSVEPSLTICGPVADPDPPGTPQAEEEEEESRVPHNDDALVGLFLEILGGDDGTDAEPPEPVWKEPPPAWAPDPALGSLSLLAGTPRKSLVGSPAPDYRNVGVAVSSRAGSPSPEQGRGDDDGRSFSSSSQYKLLLFPPPPPSGAPYRAVMAEKTASRQANGPVPRGAATPPQPSGYKSFGGLVGWPATGPLQLWGEQGDLLGGSRAQLFSSRPPRQEASSWDVPAVPCSAESWLPGYRPLRPASQEDSCRLDMASPYRPLVDFRGVPEGGPRGEEAWPDGAWGQPLAFAFRQCVEEEEEEDAGQEGAGRRTERFPRQVAVATL